jgi:hypothetical protein
MHWNGTTWRRDSHGRQGSWWRQAVAVSANDVWFLDDTAYLHRACG